MRHAPQGRRTGFRFAPGRGAGILRVMHLAPLRRCLSFLALATAGFAWPVAPARAQDPTPAESRPPAVDFKRLMPLLPAAPSGWVASAKPRGNTLQLGAYGMANVEADFKKDGGVAEAKVEIFDYALQKDLLNGMISGWNFSNESTEGWQKSVKVDGFPGFETWEEEGKKFETFVAVAGRFWVHVQVTSESADDARKWVKLVDYKKLEAMK